jgi:hypothetical protein
LLPPEIEGKNASKERGIGYARLSRYFVGLKGGGGDFIEVWFVRLLPGHARPKQSQLLKGRYPGKKHGQKKGKS